MSIKSRTIDNLGIEASNQYAKGQEALASGLVEDSRKFTITAEGGLPPYIPAEGIDSFTIFSMKGHTVWAAFSPPANYSALSPRLFTYSFIPSLGGSERLQTLADKLESLEKTIPQDRVQHHECKTLHSFVIDLVKFCRTHELIQSGRNQYQRG